MSLKALHTSCRLSIGGYEHGLRERKQISWEVPRNAEGQEWRLSDHPASTHRSFVRARRLRASDIERTNELSNERASERAYPATEQIYGVIHNAEK
jgi:hypothetical protein